MAKYFLSILLTLSSLQVFAQDVETIVAQQVEIIRSGKRPDNKALKTFIDKKPEMVFQAVQLHQFDTLNKIREWIYVQYGNILLEHKKTLSLRANIVAKLADGVVDVELSNRNTCVEILSQCNKEDFTIETQTKLSDAFSSKVWISKEFILLIGFIGNASCRTTLSELAYNPAANQRRFQWSSNLALARMGDQDAMNWCLARVTRIGLNDDVTYELLPGLIYTRQKRAIEYLVSVLNSDEKRCTSSDPDNEVKIICAYRVMEYLAPIIKHYPLDLQASGDINTKDYDKALKTVRKWFAEHADYEILTDKF